MSRDQCTICNYADKEVAALYADAQRVARDAAGAELAEVRLYAARLSRISDNLQSAIALYNDHWDHAHRDKILGPEIQTELPF